MRYAKQIFIILIISLVGELLNLFIPLPIPGSIYGMVLLFVLLCTGVVKLHQMKDTSAFLIDIMPMLFIPSAVGIMAELDQLTDIWVEVIIITIGTTVLVMAVTGLTTQALIRLKRRKEVDYERHSE